MNTYKLIVRLNDLEELKLCQMIGGFTKLDSNEYIIACSELDLLSISRILKPAGIYSKQISYVIIPYYDNDKNLLDLDETVRLLTSMGSISYVNDCIGAWLNRSKRVQRERVALVYMEDFKPSHVALNAIRKELKQDSLLYCKGGNSIFIEE